jgi:hypothetical protein
MPPAARASRESVLRTTPWTRQGQAPLDRHPQA